MESNKPDGPSPETLRFLNNALPSVVAGMEQKRIGGRGKPIGVTHVKKPKKCCRVCAAFFGHVVVPQTEDIMMEIALCDRCISMLNEGYIAFTCDDRFAFAKSKGKLAKDAGKVLRLPRHLMDRMEETFGIQSSKKENADPTENSAGPS